MIVIRCSSREGASEGGDRIRLTARCDVFLILRGQMSANGVGSMKRFGVPALAIAFAAAILVAAPTFAPLKRIRGTWFSPAAADAAQGSGREGGNTRAEAAQRSSRGGGQIRPRPAEGR